MALEGTVGVRGSPCRVRLRAQRSVVQEDWQSWPSSPIRIFHWEIQGHHLKKALSSQA